MKALGHLIDSHRFETYFDPQLIGSEHNNLFKMSF